MAELTTLKAQAINTEVLKLRVLNGRSYLVGPTVMAKECVMNGLLYPKDELKRAVGGWNGRPVTVGHPKADGNFISANEPSVLEDAQIGFIFDTSMRSDDGGMQSEVWLDVTKLDKFDTVRDTVQNGGMLEVSTGLFLDRVEKEGVFNGVKYNGVATNHLPDHLALLPGEIGACSIKDGAGFPRANQQFSGNEIALHERLRILRNKMEEMLDGSYFYIVDVFDKNFVYGTYPDKLFARDYDLNKETGALTVGEAVEVFQKVEYPPITSLGANNMAEVKPDDKAKAEAEAATNKAKAEKEVAEKEAAENKAKSEKEAAGKEAAANKAKAEKEAAEKAKAEAAANADATEALEVLAEQKALRIKEILGNEQNSFTEDELNGMKYRELQKIASLAKPAHANVDRAGMGGPGGINASGSVCEEKPYIGA